MNKQWLKLFAVFVLLLSFLLTIQPVFAIGGGSGLISLDTLGSSYTQDFGILATSGTTNDLTISGWYLDESGASALNNGQYSGGTGSSNSGDTYSFGVAGTNPVTDRAFGGLRSGTLIPTIGASFTNNTGVTITQLDVAYTGEMWRAGVTNRGASDRLDFQLSTDATSLVTGTWADYDSLDFSSPNINATAGALDGNAVANHTALSFSITGLSIPAGGTFWIRWTDFDISSSDDGLAVDDFSITPNGDAPADPVINEFSASTAGTDVEYVEIFAAPNTDLSGFSVLEIEGDVGTATGTVDEVIALGTTAPNGLYLADLAANALENGTISLLLVEGFTGALNADLDIDNDGVFDSTPWTRIVDAVAVNDGGAGDLTYGVPALGVSYDGQQFAPGGASRIPDGTDTDTAADWVRNDFDLAGIPGFTGTPVAGEAYNTPGAANQAVPTGDIPPTVTSTNPADNATNVPADTNIIITFSEEVTVTGTWFTISCNTSGAHTATVMGGPVSYTLDPDGNFTAGELCTVTVVADNVTDLDGTPDQMAENYTFAFTIISETPPLTLISAIQGSGGTVTGPGPFTVEAIVVGDYQTQGDGQLRGFFIQEEDADADTNPATSEGIFVFCSSCPTPVSVGDKVRIIGAASEFFNMSQLTATTAGSVSLLSSSNPLPTPAHVELPVPNLPTGDLAAATVAINTYFEAFEGMLVSFPDTLTVSEYFELARYGQVILTEGGRPHTFTAVNPPSAAGLIDHEINLASRTIILDDTDNRQNRPVDTPNTPYYHPVPGLSTTNYFRGGDTITNLTGVLHWSFAGQTGTDAWRIRPVTEAYSYSFSKVNPRPVLPEVDGSLKVASFNVLNYFLTIDTANTCAPTQNQDCRGADSDQELERQRTKLLAALSAIDADVFGFMEMENTPGVEPLADLVDGLPGYDYIDTGVIGTDAIRVGIIYKTSTVSPVGNYAILDSSVDPQFDSSRNRPALAQTFEEITTGARFTVVVNHLKSKGSGCGAGDDDTTTGQGNCNLTRTLAAQALADWLATDPTGGGDTDVLIIGDLNSYAKEDPIVALQNADYIDLVADFGGTDAYGYVFDGQLGYLDHALANASLYPQVAGVAEWHINADEIPLFDYNDDERTADEAAFEEESDSFPLYEPNEFRTSDHDPVIIGLKLTPPDTTAPETTIDTYPTDPSASADATFTFSSNEDPVTFECQLDGGGFTACTSPAQYTGLADGSHTFQVRAVDAAGNEDESPASHTWTIDATGPQTTITANPANPSNSTSASFSFTGNDGTGVGVASFECQLDGGGWAVCTSPQNYAGLQPGSHTFEVRAVDALGNVDPTPAGYTWTINAPVYTFSGFYAPVLNPPDINQAKAGSKVVLKFSLGGAYGLNIFEAGYPAYREIDCGTQLPLGPLQTAAGSSLKYNARSGEYTFTWATAKGWTGCRELIFMFNDGTEATAWFRFK